MSHYFVFIAISYSQPTNFCFVAYFIILHLQNYYNFPLYNNVLFVHQRIFNVSKSVLVKSGFHFQNLTKTIDNANQNVMWWNFEILKLWESNWLLSISFLSDKAYNEWWTLPFWTSIPFEIWWEYAKALEDLKLTTKKQ